MVKMAPERHLPVPGHGHLGLQQEAFLPPNSGRELSYLLGTVLCLAPGNDKLRYYFRLFKVVGYDCLVDLACQEWAARVVTAHLKGRKATEMLPPMLSIKATVSHNVPLASDDDTEHNYAIESRHQENKPIKGTTEHGVNYTP